MAMNQQNYAATPRCAVGQVSAANTARDGTGTLATIITAGASGTLIEDIVITATGTTTAGMIRLFEHDGTNARFIREVPVQAAIPSGTVSAFTASLLNLGWILQSGWSLRAATHNTETFNVFVTKAGDF